MPQPKRGKAPKSLYSVHPNVATIQKWIAELPEKTGKTLEQWIALVRNSGPAGEQERRDWLKKEHGFGTNTAGWIVERAAGSGDRGIGEDDPATYLELAQRYVEAMYAGGKTGLRPIYDELLRLGLELGDDVRACPCKTIVPLYRTHVFAEIKPATRTRIDLGLALGKAKGKLAARLIDTGGAARKDRITHRIPIVSHDDIDEEVKRWLKTAYDLDA